ncbi:hypothetical protein H8959_008236, partial [Pygathrix nigripes]
RKAVQRRSPDRLLEKKRRRHEAEAAVILDICSSPSKLWRSGHRECPFTAMEERKRGLLPSLPLHSPYQHCSCPTSHNLIVDNLTVGFWKQCCLRDGLPELFQ